MANAQQLASFNALVVGGGAIGSAMVERLLGMPNLARISLLSRSPADLPGDARLDQHRFDATDPDSVSDAAAVIGGDVERLHLVVNTVGMLHDGAQQPEKRLRDITPGNLAHAFALNASLLPLLAQAFGPLLRHDEPATLASLSARVGSIGDNGMGGWYSYRASKAAHNMLLRTLSREWRVSHRNVTVLALHPGTVESRLSRPFISPNYGNRVLSPGESAEALLGVMAAAGPDQSGTFLDWRGESIPW